MDFHLTVCKHLSVAEAHSIADHLEKRIEQDIRGADVTIHIEPCRKPDCPGRNDCGAARARFGQETQGLADASGNGPMPTAHETEKDS